MAQPLHHEIGIDGVKLFYRSAGPTDAPAVLLLHGFPSSSFQFRHVLTGLSDRWHVIAPDLPGFGFTNIETQSPYLYSFERLADTIARWIETLKLNIAAVYLHDYGGQVGFRLLLRRYIEPRAVIIQNTEAYHAIGWHDPMRAIDARQKEPPGLGRARLRETLMNENGIRKEFYEELPPEIAARIDPAASELGWKKICSPGILEAMLDLHMDYGSNVRCYEDIQSFLRNSNIPTLLLWGERDQYLSVQAGRAYLRDLPDAELVTLDGGHWLLESHIDEVNYALRSFLSGKV